MRYDTKAILTAINSTENFDKYPIGNKGLTEALKTLEAENKIKWNALTRKWEKFQKRNK